MKLKICIYLLVIFLICSCKRHFDNSSVILDYSQSLSAQSKFCVIGDTGTGQAPQLQVAKGLEEEGCDAIVHVGDIIYPNSLRFPQVEKTVVDPEFIHKFYNPYKTILEVRNIPYFLVVGNHEYWGDSRAWINLAKSQRFRSKIILPEYYYAARFGDVCAAFVETNTRFNQQRSWLKKQVFSDFSDCKYRIAFGHHPFVSSGEHGPAKGARKALLRDLVIGKFDLYISGHEHFLSDEGVVDGTRQLISGGGGAWVREIIKHPVWGLSRNGYVVLSFSNGKILYKFRAISEGGEMQTVHQGTIAARGVR